MKLSNPTQHLVPCSASGTDSVPTSGVYCSHCLIRHAAVEAIVELPAVAAAAAVGEECHSQAPIACVLVEWLIRVRSSLAEHSPNFSVCVVGCTPKCGMAPCSLR